MTNINAVIVTHNPPGGMPERLEAILSQVDYLVIVDNNSDDATQKNLKAIQPHHDGKIAIIWNKTNKGLATALNQGIRHALSRNADWILLLDHDSQPERNMVARMLAAYEAYPAKEYIGLIAPEINDQNITSKTQYLVPRGKCWFQKITLDEPYTDKVLSVITSGSLIKADIFNAIGLMPDHFFIDYIDHAFCLKMKKYGYNILLVKDAILRHKLGDKKEYIIAGVKVAASHHSATRRYYIFRNRLWVWKRNASLFPHFVAHDILAAGFDVLRITFYEKQKWQKLKAIMKGIGAGLGREPV